MSSQVKLNILFVCPANGARSQMAEAWTRTLKSQLLRPASAGLTTGAADPLAARVMSELTIDLSAHRPKSLDELGDTFFDAAVILADGLESEVRNRVSPRTILLVHPVDDPAAGSDNGDLAPYREARAQIRKLVESLPEALF